MVTVYKQTFHYNMCYSISHHSKVLIVDVSDQNLVARQSHAVFQYEGCSNETLVELQWLCVQYTSS